MSAKYLKTILILLVAALLGIGLLMIYSSSTMYSTDRYGDSYFLLKRQLIWLGVGLGFFFMTFLIDYHWLQRRSRLLLLVGILLLIAVFIPGLGRSSGGATRWLSMGGVGFQPSELVKYLVIIYLADLLSRRQKNIKKFLSGFLPSLAVIGLLCSLTVIQPDLGSALSIGVIGLLMLFLGGSSLIHMSGLALMVLPILIILIARVGYRMRRILAFIDPWADPKGTGFQIIQSLIALGSGGPLGLGLGESRQKLFYLPAATTDFIFSILGEEIGFVGTGLVIVLVIGLVIVGFAIGRRADDLFGSLLAQGITAMLALQAMVNMGVSSGILPTKGLPFPFISYGGSNLIVSLFAVGILANIAADQEKEYHRQPMRRPEYIFSLRSTFPAKISRVKTKGAVAQIDEAEREAIMRRFRGAPTKEYLNGTSRRSNAGRAHKSLSPCGLRRFWAYTALRLLEIPQRVFHRSRALSKPKIDSNSAHLDLGSSPLGTAAQIAGAEQEAIMRRFQGVPTKECLKGTSRRSNAERTHNIL